MAIKTFTTGEVLTAADTNTYLANSGLVYITSGALSGTSTNFAGCFTTTYDNYRIVISSVSFSANAFLYFRMLSGTTPQIAANYSWGYTGIDENGVGKNSNFAGSTQGYLGVNITIASNVLGSASIDCFSPMLAQRTFLSVNAVAYPGAFATLNGFSHYNPSTAYDGIQFLTSAVPTMTGTVTIYGYRKP